MKRISSLSVLLLLVIFLPGPIDSIAGELPINEFRSAYGGSVTIARGDVIVSENSGFSTPGMVHVLRKGADGDWTEVQVLKSISPLQGDGFGSVVAADGNTLFVSMFSRKESAGVVYVFEKNSNDVWENTQILKQDNDSQGEPGRDESSQGERFGATMVVIGHHAVIGAPGQDGGTGAIYTYMNDGEEWGMMDSLRPEGLLEKAAFGSTLSFKEGLLAVAAPGAAAGAGSVYTYRTRNNGHSWTQEGGVISSDAENIRQFGSVLMTDGKRVYVGQPFANDLSGNVHVFRPTVEGDWVEETILTPVATGDTRLRFGAALASAGDELWVAVPGAREDAGEVYRYSVDNDVFGRTGTIEYDEAQQPRGRGSVLAVEGNTAVIGVKSRDYGEGIALIAEREGEKWSVVGDFYRNLGEFTRVTGEKVDCEDGRAASWSCDNVDLISFIPSSELGAARGSRFNDVWGWTDPQTGKEYGILGHMEAAIFVDLSDPYNPVVLGELPRTKGSPGSTHRDIKVYKDYAFIVADGAENHGMQVFDLRILRDVPDPPVVFEPSALYTGIASAHNIVINEATGYAYTVGGRSGGETCGGALHMINIQDPLHPTFAGCFRDSRTGRDGSGATHDAQCVTYHGPDTEHAGQEICIGYNGTAVSIADVSDKDNPVPISIGTYPNSAYVHQGWLTEDQRYFYQDDEADENRGIVEKTRTMIWDVTDLDDPVMINEFYGKENSTDHNLYVNGDLMYQTNNASGLRIVDIKDREHPVEVGFFDTTPENLNVAGFDGTWSSYPFFKSGMILVSSRREGMFVLKKREVDI